MSYDGGEGGSHSQLGHSSGRLEDRRSRVDREELGLESFVAGLVASTVALRRAWSMLPQVSHL